MRQVNKDMEEVRRMLGELVAKGALCDDEVIKLSRQLDEIINKFMKFDEVKASEMVQKSKDC